MPSPFSGESTVSSTNYNGAEKTSTCGRIWTWTYHHIKKLKPIKDLNLFFFFLKFILLIYFWLCWVFVAARRLSLVAGEWGLLFVALRRLLFAVASLVVEHGL